MSRPALVPIKVILKEESSISLGLNLYSSRRQESVRARIKILAPQNGQWTHQEMHLKSYQILCSYTEVSCSIILLKSGDTLVNPSALDDTGCASFKGGF